MKIIRTKHSSLEQCICKFMKYLIRICEIVKTLQITQTQKTCPKRGLHYIHTKNKLISKKRFEEDIHLKSYVILSFPQKE